VSTTPLQLPDPSIRGRLLQRGAVRWYLGTIWGLAYQSIEIVSLWSNSGSIASKTIATVLLAILYAGYIVIPPLVWPETVRVRVIVLLAYWAATLVVAPFIGVYVIWTWPLVGAMVAFCWLPARPSLFISAAIVAAQLLVGWAAHFANGLIYAPIVTATTLVGLFGITSQIMTNRRLKDAQSTVAALAAAEERARLARDLHDVLGHSLTVVAVKSELAGRLVDIDPVKAKAEIADIEQLARTALADLRAAVSTARETSLDSELSAARTALEAAGIEPHLPVDGATVNEELRPLFSWVVREGVTNVIRHSRASACWIELEPTVLRVRDDGAGATHSGAGTASGNGLRGLRERAVESGAEISIDQGDTGFVLTARQASA
jgi:two-component system sensor histidine kinase DesK